MKNVLIIIAIWCSMTAVAQEEKSVEKEESISAFEVVQDTILKSNPEDEYEIKTLFGSSEKNHNGGFGSVFVDYHPTNNGNSINEELFVGFRAGWIINHSFSIGIGGSGLVTESRYGNKISALPDTDVQLEMGYGGLYLEPILWSSKPVHVTFPVLLGAGGAFYTSGRPNYKSDSDWDHDSYDDLDRSWFFVVEPGMNLEFNVTKAFRIAFTGKYRFLGGLELENTDPTALDKWSVGMEFKLGVF